METNNIEKVKFAKITQNIMELIRKHADPNSELEKDLFELISLVETEQRKSEEIKSLAFELANKLT
jgi:ribosome biogenesis protein Nip4